MNISTYWDCFTSNQKLYVLADAGWHTPGRGPDRTARKCSAMCWDDLSPAMRTVLTRKAAEGQIFV